MARLALAATKGTSFEGEHVLLPVDRRTADAAAKQGGELVLVYQLVPQSFALFVGQGRIAGIEFGERAEVAVRLAGYVPFTSPVPGVAELKLPRVRSMLRLSEERYAEILSEAAVPMPDAGASEAQASLGTRVTIKRQVLRNWGNRCAITGARDGLDIVAIRPREAGGRLHALNYMPMIPIAARAWEQGAISVGPNMEILAVLDRLEPELLERMERGGRLLLPENPAFHPDPGDLAYHRQHVFGW